ncbi:MAG: PaaI family thioesterase [Lachnospiraceae bacterium]|nr:PaaI family thioesterase [Lachnospiraceae bacterium]
MTEDYSMSRLPNPFVEYNGIEICEISMDHCLVKATIADHSKNPYGMVHGGLMYTMIDAASAINARADGHRYVTNNVYVDYLGNGKDLDVIYAESNIIKRGKNVAVVEAKVRTEEGKVLAIGNVNMFRID